MKTFYCCYHGILEPCSKCPPELFNELPEEASADTADILERAEASIRARYGDLMLADRLRDAAACYRRIDAAPRAIRNG